MAAPAPARRYTPVVAGRIPESFIESLLERVDIVEIIGHRVPLKPAGREFKACCPFHDEKTPSFYVSPQKQFYHCFGCGAHGTAIGFVMQYDGLEFPAAVEELAGHAGLEVPREAGQAAAPKHDGLYSALAAANEFFRDRLQSHGPARGYLEQRGLDADTIEAFEIGYAPADWSALAETLSRQGHTHADLVAAGLAGAREDGRLTDRFRDRIMFPIHDRRGRVIAFGGRALSDKGPKYLNSAESPVFHKGRELYRLFQVRRGGLPERLLVVEGYMDAAALHQHGFAETVATLGTAVTPDHLELMFRATSVVMFCFDGDEAGRRAAWKGLEGALPVMRSNREVRFLFLPEGEDPDSLVRGRGAEGFGKLLESARPLSEFLFEELARPLDLHTPDGRARLVALAEPLLERLPAGPFADLMAGELERRAGHPGHWQPRPVRPSAARPAGTDRPLTPVQYAVAILVQYPRLAQAIDSAALDGPGELKGVKFLKGLIDFCVRKPQVSTAVILERWRDRSEGPYLAALAQRNLAGGEEQLEPALTEAIDRIRAEMVRTRIRQLQEHQASRGLDEVQAGELRDLLAGRNLPGK